jgi:hypothetical protein
MKGRREYTENLDQNSQCLTEIRTGPLANAGQKGYRLSQLAQSLDARCMQYDRSRHLIPSAKVRNSISGIYCTAVILVSMCYPHCFLPKFRVLFPIYGVVMSVGLYVYVFVPR